MAKGCTTNTYEEARKQRLEENKKRFEDLGISKISKNLTELATPEKKALQHRPKPKSKSNDVVEPRRSARMRHSVPSYREDVGMDFLLLRKRSRSSSSTWGSYVVRPLDEVKEATKEERNRAFMVAEALLSNLQSSNPTFIKSMVRSHVYSCFWLGLPTRFCQEHLPKTVCDMVLEDENGSEYKVVFIGNRSGLSGGWRGFALDHKLDDGDALVFELVEPTKFKIYIVKAFPYSVEDGQEILDETAYTCATKKHKSQSNKTQMFKQEGIVREINESASSQEHLAENNVENEIELEGLNPARKTRFSQRKSQKESKDCKLLAADGSRGEEHIEGIINSANGIESQELNSARKTRFSQKKLLEESEHSKLPAGGDSKREHIEEGKNCTAEKAKAAIKHNSRPNKTPRSKRGIVHETDDLGSGVKPRCNIENEVKTEMADSDKNGFVEQADGELKKVKPVEGGKCASQKTRKKLAPKYLRKKA